MSLLNIINKIRTHIIENDPPHSELVSPQKPNIVIGDVYSVNNNTNIQYPLWVISQGNHQYNIEKNYVYYNLTIFFIDEIGVLGGEYIQVKQYKYGINEVPVSVQSGAILNFFTLVKQLEDDGYVIDNINNITITPFTEKFNDVCCGVYIQLKIREELTKCNVWFGQEPPEDSDQTLTNTISETNSETDFELDGDCLGQL